MKCMVCKQMFLKNIEKLSGAKKKVREKTCPGCRIIGSRAPERPFKERKK